MHNLRPAILEQGLVAALQWMTSRFEKRTGIACQLRAASHEPLQLPAGVPLVAYRTAQEALTNVTKHAQATRGAGRPVAGRRRAVARGQRQRPRPEPATTWPRRARFGIRGLHERAGTVGGWVDLSSGAGRHDADPVGAACSRPATAALADRARRRRSDPDDPYDPSRWGDPDDQSASSATTTR